MTQFKIIQKHVAHIQHETVILVWCNLYHHIFTFSN